MSSDEAGKIRQRSMLYFPSAALLLKKVNNDLRKKPFDSKTPPINNKNIKRLWYNRTTGIITRPIHASKTLPWRYSSNIGINKIVASRGHS